MFDPSLPYPSTRQPVSGDCAIATSQPLAAQAGMAMLQAGGTAVDAAIAAAMALVVVEPTGCGLGSDAYAIVWDGARLSGLNASGRAPAAWRPELFAGQSRMPERGWPSVTVPGAVSGWIALWRRFGTLPLDQIAAPALRFAEEGFVVSPVIARLWHLGGQALSAQPGFAECFLPGGRAPKAGDRIRLPGHAATLRRIVETEGESFYRGALAQRIADHAAAHGGHLTAEDMAAHQPAWVDTLHTRFGDHLIHELPPNGQGLGALIGLGVLDRLDWQAAAVDDARTHHLAIEATKLGLVDAAEHVTDPAWMRHAPEAFLTDRYLDSRAALVDPAHAGDPGHGTPGAGGTVYLSVADRDGRMVSFIQSNYMGFGSGVVVPGTGISLQNRGAGFSLTPGHVNIVAPRKQPFQTIIPAFATDLTGAPVMSFGVMGGPMQAQGHLQMALRVLGFGQNPQAAADAPRWRVTAGRGLALESGFDDRLAADLAALGHEIVRESPDAVFGFGGAQLIRRMAGGYVAGSDPRKDGQALAF
ncbi:gamma-glutamyltransferase family protein [Salipiger marinus]|uniref:Gamma-glutamyltranspeptidase / glutathione hydrolase n=1 Tax=Salipiger marinus TaxID=555512 RepID=A0A1G8P3M7_9RHOB|nr:gamma-glutamyltransferase family protein [Salipiger marinus]SDI86876.1 gamma-glutamyltranspeptidase / glutathione hydrolase [Salipiger marinus]